VLDVFLDGQKTVQRWRSDVPRIDAIILSDMNVIQTPLFPQQYLSKLSNSGVLDWVGPELFSASSIPLPVVVVGTVELSPLEEVRSMASVVEAAARNRFW
jgi:hypothetical protein